MKTYIVFFELYNKRMKITVQAENEGHAKAIVRNKIEFHKVVEQLPEVVVEDDAALQQLKNFFGIK